MKKKSKKQPAKKVAKRPIKKTAKKVAKKVAKKPAKKAVKKVVKKSTKKVVKQVAKKRPSKKIAKKVLKKSIKKVAKKVKPVQVAKKKVTKPAKKVVSKSKAKSAPKAPNPVPFKAHQSRLKVGDMAPYFEGIDQHGNMLNLYELAGKKIILYFYPKDDTPGCTATACSLRDEYQLLGQNNYAVVGVSADDQDSHAKFASKFELPFPLLADTDKTIIKAYDVWGTKMLMGNIYDGIVRTTFVISEDGILEQVIHAVDTASHAQQILSL